MKKIILTGGGTAGHVTPNLALIPSLRAEGWEIHYIGTENGIERRLIEAVDGVTYHVVKSGKLRRYFDLKNFTDPFRVIQGAFQAGALVKKIQPDIVFSKGGFVSVPVSLQKKLRFLSFFVKHVKNRSEKLCKAHNHPKENKAFCPSTVNMLSRVMIEVAVSISRSGRKLCPSRTAQAVSTPR
ncbi:MAG: glycosyltransferase [Clostridia bacterium]|nr:glycosyltransferase [Clostridia bacterium]